MENYRVYLHLELLETMPRRGTQARRILKFLTSLEEHPFTSGDYTDKDSSFRTRQIKMVGDYAITYWPDHPVKIVMVVDIRKAD